VREGQDSKIAGYLMKGMTNVTRTMPSGDEKQEWTPWKLLARAQQSDTIALARFLEFAYATKGRHRISWSRGLRSALGLNTERSDEDIVAADEQMQHSSRPSQRMIGFIAPPIWKHLRMLGMQDDLLDVIHTDRWDAGVVFLEQVQRTAICSSG
jgi:hypothetical protein